MKFISLFAGIGGFDLGFEREGFECVGQVEIDKHARAILDKQFPAVPKWDDVTTAKEWANEQQFGKVDMVVGGFPCQDLSVAGRRAGLAGGRSGLFFDAVDFAVQVKADWLVLENVPGLFSSNKGRDFIAVLAALRNAGYHYVEWRVFNSQFYGVPQRRRRIYIIAGTRDPRKFPVFIEREGSSWNSAPKPETGQEVTGAAGNSIIGSLQARDFKGVGNQYVEEGKLVWQPVDDRETMPTLTASTYHHGTVVNQDVDAGYLAVYENYGIAKYREGVGTLRAAGGDIGGGSENLAVFAKRRNAQSADDYETWAEAEVAFTLNAFDIGDVRAKVLLRMRSGKEGGGKGALLSEEKSLTLATSNDQTLFTESAVRRLTPTECERLQGFPDGWTDGQADTHRYKQLGNAVTVNVAQAVARLLKAAL